MAARGKSEATPGAELQALAEALAGGELPRALVIRGDERWYRDRAVELAVAAARKQDLELARHDAQDPDFRLASLCDDLAAPPMFAAARAVVVRNAGRLLKKDDATDDPPFPRAAQTFVADRAVPGMLVIEAEGLRADSVLAKGVVAAGGRLCSFRRLWDTPPPWSPDPRRTELVEWLTARARERKVALKPEEALYVAAATGNDLYALDAALERIARRGTQGVRAVVGWSSAASPFQVAEDLCRGDAPRTVAGLEALFRGGFQEKDGARATDFGAVFAVLTGSLRSKLRQSLTGATVLERGGDVAAAADAAEVTNPRQRGEFEARIRARPAADWRRMLAELATLERRSRSGATVDVNDLVLFALHWARTAARPAVAAPARR